MWLSTRIPPSLRAGSQRNIAERVYRFLALADGAGAGELRLNRFENAVHARRVTRGAFDLHNRADIREDRFAVHSIGEKGGHGILRR
jgi:hypothetical protein